MPLEGGMNGLGKKNLQQNIVIKDEPELFSRITMRGKGVDDDEEDGDTEDFQKTPLSKSKTNVR